MLPITIEAVFSIGDSLLTAERNKRPVTLILWFGPSEPCERPMRELTTATHVKAK